MANREPTVEGFFRQIARRLYGGSLQYARHPKSVTQFMIDYDIGVTTARTYTVKRIDQDYFEEEEG